MAETICKLETNLDDCSGEALGYAMTLLLEAGARDVHYIPVFMKKNRPGWQLNVICLTEDREKMEEIIFRETTSIGIRCMQVDRTVMDRELKRVETPYGEVIVKVCSYREIRKVYPEYESVAGLARQKGLPFQTVFDAAKAWGEKAYGKDRL